MLEVMSTREQTPSPRARQLAHFHQIIKSRNADAANGETRIYRVYREGEGHVWLAWEEMTMTERVFQVEAEERAAEIMSFNPCGLF